MNEARVAPIRPHIFVGIDELLLVFIRPKRVHIIALSCPLLGVIPRILQSYQIDFLRFASRTWIADHYSSDIKYRIHVLRLQSIRFSSSIHPFLICLFGQKKLIINFASDDRMIITQSLERIVKCAFVSQSLRAANYAVFNWDSHHICKSFICGALVEGEVSAVHFGVGFL